MAVMPRETWTDERLDDLNSKVDDGFREVRADLRQFRGEVNARFDSAEVKADARFDSAEARTDGRFDSVDTRIEARFDAMQRLIIQVGAGLFGTMLVGFVGLVATILATNS